MDPAAQRALDKLRDPEGAALRALARIVVEETTRTPLREIATPRWLAGQVATALEAGTRTEMLRDWVDRRIDSERARWGEEERKLGSYLPEEAEKPLRDMLGRAYAPDEELTHRIIDQPAMRRLVRVLLTDALRSFGKRLREADNVVGGLGKRAARRSRALFQGLNVGLSGVTDNLSGVAGAAESLVGAVKDEVEGAFEKRVTDFADGATSRTLRSMASYIADPDKAEGFAEFRLAILDVLLDTPIKDLAGEADKLGPEELVSVVVAAVRSAVAAEDFVDRTEARIAAALDEAGDGTLGAWLAEVGLEEVWTETTTELVAARLQAVVDTEPFLAWWTALFE